jgi:thiol-disulfide isomerase/thioredoxin
MNRRLMLGLIAASLWGADAGIKLSSLDGGKLLVDPAASGATVLVFLSAVCPVSNAYTDRLNDLVGRYAGKPVRFVFVNSNELESVDEVKEHARASRYPVPVYKDFNNVVADRYNARVTPETVVLDRNGIVRYRGGVDDAQNPARVKVEGLKLAIDAVLSGQPVKPTEIRTFGCTIKRVRKGS